MKSSNKKIEETKIIRTIIKRNRNKRDKRNNNRKRTWNKKNKSITVLLF